MKVALFSDVHGHLRIVLHLIRNWQIEHNSHLDGALIAGDLGCFPDSSKLDKATRRWVAVDPEQAGFTVIRPDATSLLATAQINVTHRNITDPNVPIEARWPITVWLTDRTEDEVPVGSKIMVNPEVRAAILGEDVSAP
jgi:hypothetical protein